MKKIKLKVNKKQDKVKAPKEKKVIWKSVLSFLLICAIGVISLALVFALYIVITSPNFDKSELYQKEPTILYDKYGAELARVGAMDSVVITYDEIPDVLIDALIATEDSRFFQHNGLDLFRFLKASFGQILGSDSAGGASTLSMQVIKRTYTSSQDEGLAGIIRKFTDIYMAVFKLEANYTKEEIIEFYLNSQWFANAGDINIEKGIYGIEQASLYFFGKSSKDLNLAEASLLVGMFQNTYYLNPYSYPDKAKDRQKTVLKLMVRHGYITQEEADNALAIPLDNLLLKQDKGEILQAESKQAFIDYCLDEVETNLGVDPREVSLKIYTTFDPKIQEILEKVEDGDVYKFPNSYEETDEYVDEGIAVTSVADGSIVALSGGRNYKGNGQNLATDIKKQPGSTAKPIFDYAMYIEHISHSSYAMFLDEPTTYSTGQRITNYDNGYKHLITLRDALRDSRNIPAYLAFKDVANLDQKIIEDFVHSVGIDYGDTLYESASIGGFDGVSPLQMAAAYATFARGGYYIKPYTYTRIINNETEKEINYSYSKEKVMEESTAYMINNILNNYGAGGDKVASKTGTTNLPKDVKDNNHLPSGAILEVWYNSYSTEYSVSLWYGYKQLYPNAAETKHYLNSSSGGTARSTIMSYLAKNIHKNKKEFPIPKGVTGVNIEKETFPPKLCSAYTPKNLCVTEYFVSGTEPTDASSRFDTLPDPTNGSFNFSGNTITLKWTPISTPEAIDPTALANHFNEYYGSYANQYYNSRLQYNNTNIGNLIYRIYLKNSDGTLTEIGTTTGNTFNYSASVGGNYTFVVKASYSIFKYNMSNGLTISTRTIDNNVNNMVDGNQNNSNNNNTNNDDDTGLN